MSQRTLAASLFTEDDIYLFKEGKHFRLYEKLGAHQMRLGGVLGTYFAVWAPNAETVSVVGDFNGWDPTRHHLFPRWDSSGIFEGFIPEVGNGALYKYFIISKANGIILEKGDPFGFRWEVPPRTASIVWDLKYEWDEKDWEAERKAKNDLSAPFSVYEMHYGSWARVVEDHNRPLTYREMAEKLPEYLHEMGFTHVEFMPLMEHPFLGSWGYQKVGYFAPSSRYGTPQDFMFLIETLHQKNIGVILDWVPSHFPSDGHGLAFFDGTHLFEHADKRQGFHPDWQSYIFNYGRNEVKSFLISSALFWCDKYHIDGLRVDAVASMLYLDYSRKRGEWIPNAFGGNENLEAIHFLKDLNTAVYGFNSSLQMIAEESTAWPMVSRPVYLGGLGFGMKWNMGWMHDTLVYFSKDPVYRKFHQGDLLFSMLYAYNENFMLSISHDEVVHGKQSLLSKMPGDDWQKFANVRLLIGYMYAHPGKKLLFMGAEIGQWSEWNHDHSLDWHLLSYERHEKLQKFVRDMNHLYIREKAMHELDFTPDGFEWLDFSDSEKSVISFYRKGTSPQDELLFVFNFTPSTHENYRLGVKRKGTFREIINSDSTFYGGSDKGNYGQIETRPISCHGRDHSIGLTLPPLGFLCLKPEY